MSMSNIPAEYCLGKKTSRNIFNPWSNARARLTTAKATIFLEKQYQIARIPKEASNPNIPPIAAMTELLPSIP